MKVGCRYHGSENLEERGLVTYSRSVVATAPAQVWNEPVPITFVALDETKHKAEEEEPRVLVCSAIVRHGDAPVQECGAVVAVFDYEEEEGWLITGSGIVFGDDDA